jgi:beta-glucosidase
MKKNESIIVSYRVGLFVGLACVLAVALLPRSKAQAQGQRGKTVATATSRARGLVSRMTLEEKIGQLTQFSFGQLTGPGDRNASMERQRALIEQGRLGSVINVMGAKITNELQRIAVEKSRLKIPLLIGFDVIHGYRTTFPTPLAESSSWDLDLMKRTAAAAAAEMSAEGVRWTFAPMVDVSRDARWSRVSEGAGEDVFLGSQIAAARVRGFQGDRPNRFWTVMATAKHFAAYGLPQAGLDYATVDVSETTLRSVYLPPFAAAVAAGAGSVMTSFNEVAGMPSTANRFLLTEVLRKEWGFTGLVVSDWGSVEELVRHGLVATRSEAAKASLVAGCDMDMCTGTYEAELAGLVRRGVVLPAAVDQAVERLLRAKIQLGLFDNPYVEEGKPPMVDLPNETRALAREAAQKSIVLLKNEDDLLPLPKTGKRIALIGPFVKSTKEPLGCWPALGKERHVVTLFDAVKRKLDTSNSTVIYSLGTEFDGNNKDLKEAIAVAKSADVVVLFVGDPGWNTGENLSKVSLDLTTAQSELVRAVHAVKKPTVLVLMNGGPMTIPWGAEHIPAILETWALGVESGNAIADILFGDESPSGHLTMTIPRSVGQVPIFYDHKNSGRPPGVDGGARYTDSPTTPLWPFGHGLTYTKFSYSDLKVSPAMIPMGGKVVVQVAIENIGSRTGVAVPQLYIRDVAASLTRPVRELRGFSRITLDPGEKRQLTFELGAAQLGLWNQRNKFMVEPGEFLVWVGPDATSGLEGKFTVARAAKVAAKRLEKRHVAR